jgi:hypothetical protein
MIYKQIIEKFGREHQIRKAIEELTELSLVLQHALDGKASTDMVETEVVDVDIMLAQLKIMFDINDEKFNWIKKVKLKKIGFEL